MTSIREQLDTPRLRILRRLKDEREKILQSLISSAKQGKLQDQPMQDSAWRTLRVQRQINNARSDVVEVYQAIEKELDKEMKRLGHRPGEDWVALDNKC